MNLSLILMLGAAGYGAYWWYENYGKEAESPSAPVVTNTNASAPTVAPSLLAPTALNSQVTNASVKRNLKDLLLARGLETGLVDPQTKLARFVDWNWLYNNVSNVQGNYTDYFPGYAGGSDLVSVETFVYIASPVLGLGIGLGRVR